MKKLIIFGTAAAALVAAPLLAQIDRTPRADAGVTRADVHADVRAAFARVDADRDGFVTQSEADAFRTALRGERREQRQERRQARFDRLDADNNGVISRGEFFAQRDRSDRGDRAERRGDRRERRELRREHRDERRIGRALRGFERMDANRDGRVSLAEATRHRLDRFDRLDSNRDGRITREERQSHRAERRASRG